MKLKEQLRKQAQLQAILKVLSTHSSTSTEVIEARRSLLKLSSSYNLAKLAIIRFKLEGLYGYDVGVDEVLAPQIQTLIGKLDGAYKGQAALLMAMTLARNELDRKDEAAYEEMLRHASDLGNQRAKHILASFLLDKDKSTDKEEGQTLLEALVKEGYTDAFGRYARILMTKPGAGPQEMDEAIRVLHDGAQHQSPLCLFSLGELYAKGVHLGKDLHSATAFLQQLEALNSPLAERLRAHVSILRNETAISVHGRELERIRDILELGDPKSALAVFPPSNGDRPRAPSIHVDPAALIANAKITDTALTEMLFSAGEDPLEVAKTVIPATKHRRKILPKRPPHTIDKGTEKEKGMRRRRLPVPHVQPSRLVAKSRGDSSLSPTPLLPSDDVLMQDTCASFDVVSGADSEQYSGPESVESMDDTSVFLGTEGEIKPKRPAPSPLTAPKKKIEKRRQGSLVSGVITLAASIVLGILACLSMIPIAFTMVSIVLLAASIFRLVDRFFHPKTTKQGARLDVLSSVPLDPAENGATEALRGAFTLPSAEQQADSERSSTFITEYRRAEAEMRPRHMSPTGKREPATPSSIGRRAAHP